MTSWNWQEFFASQEDRIILAPMEGVVDRVMREVLTGVGGIDLCVTEFQRVTDRLLPASEFRKTCPELARSSRTMHGTPVLFQLLGGQPGPMAENASRACELGAIGIDLNFGCPAKTVNRHDGGATLLKIPERVRDVTEAVRKAVPLHISVSAKVRLGFSDKLLHREIAQAAESGGAAWLTVHARTRDEGYRPPAHWEYISNMRESVGPRMHVIANGEIWTVQDYFNARKVSGCRHVMIGRGLMSDPDLAIQIRAARGDSIATVDQTWSKMPPRLKTFAEISFNERGEGYAVARMKQWLKALSRRHQEALELFEKIKRFERLSPIVDAIGDLCNNDGSRKGGYFSGQSSHLHERLLPVL